MVSIFQCDWWLDAATDGNWTAVNSAPHAGISARLPIYIERRRFGLQKICMPPLTRTLGPIFSEVPGELRGSRTTMLRARLQAMEDIIANLPPYVIFQQFFDAGDSDLLAFVVHGFEVGVSYTFRLPDCRDVEATWRQMRDKTRNVIRRAAERFDVGTSFPVEDFVSFYFANVERRMAVPEHPRDRVTRILKAAELHGACTAFCCSDHAGNPVAAIFVVWDASHLYFLMSSRDERHADNGAVSLLLWHAIKLAGEKGLAFDFDGFYKYGGAMFVTQFGGQMTPRWKVSYAAPAIRLRWATRNLVAHLSSLPGSVMPAVALWRRSSVRAPAPTARCCSRRC